MYNLTLFFSSLLLQFLSARCAVVVVLLFFFLAQMLALLCIYTEHVSHSYTKMMLFIAVSILCWNAEEPYSFRSAVAALSRARRSHPQPTRNDENARTQVANANGDDDGSEAIRGDDEVISIDFLYFLKIYTFYGWVFCFILAFVCPFQGDGREHHLALNCTQHPYTATRVGRILLLILLVLGRWKRSDRWI